MVYCPDEELRRRLPVETVVKSGPSHGLSVELHQRFQRAVGLDKLAWTKGNHMAGLRIASFFASLARQVAKRSKTRTFLNIVAPVTVDQNTLEPAATAASEPFASLIWYASTNASMASNGDKRSSAICLLPSRKIVGRDPASR
jgi:hypothetical protein